MGGWAGFGGGGGRAWSESRPPHTRWLLRLLLRATLHPQGSTRPPAAHPPRDQPPPSFSCIHQWVPRHAQDAQGPRAGLWAPEDGAGCGLTSPAQTGDKGVEGRAGAPSECLNPSWGASLRPTSPPGLPPEQGRQSPPSLFASLPRPVTRLEGTRWGLGGRLCPQPPGPSVLGTTGLQREGDGEMVGERPAPAYTLRSTQEEKDK